MQMISSLDQAREVVTEGVLKLVSPAQGAYQHGVAYFIEIFKIIKAENPDIAIETYLHCGDASGYALGALRIGAEVLDGLIMIPNLAQERIKDICTQLGLNFMVLDRP